MSSTVAPRPRDGGGEVAREALPLVGAPPSRSPTCAPSPGSKPAQPRGGGASGARPAWSGARPRAPPAPRALPVSTHRLRPASGARRGPGRAAAAAAAGATAGGQAGSPRPGAPGPYHRHFPLRAPATPPAARRRRDKAAGAPGRGTGGPLPAPRGGAEGAAGSRGWGWGAATASAAFLPPPRLRAGGTLVRLPHSYTRRQCTCCASGALGARGHPAGPT